MVLETTALNLTITLTNDYGWILPWPVPSLYVKGGGLGVGPAPPHHKNMPATKWQQMELTSPGRRSEEDHTNGFMMVGDHGREDISSSIADLLMPKRRTRVGFWDVRALFHSGRLAQSIREMNNNLAIRGIAEARWAGTGKQRVNSGETIIRSGKQDNTYQEEVTLIIASKYANTLLQ